ncbi:MAG: DUF3311 domain-containing protein [Pirellulaceae bacterium]|nr:DUF3311 domain-containing protein [Pirellulaceae bacterium]
MKSTFWSGLIVLFVLHHDFWLWSDDRLLLGVMPVGLAWHVGYSLVTGAFWWLAVRYCWPNQLESWAGQADQSPSS